MPYEVLQDSSYFKYTKVANSYYSHFVFTKFEDRTTYRTENYYEKKARGEYIPPQPYSHHRYETYDDAHDLQLCLTLSRFGCRPSCWTETRFGGYYAFTFESIPLPNLEDPAAKLLGKLNVAEVNAALTFFERKDTFSMLTSHLSRMTQAARAVRRGRFKEASSILGIKLSQRAKKRLNRNRLDQFTDNWLEYRYGWVPLCNDIYNTSLIISDGVNKKGDIVSLRSSSSDSGSKTVSIISNNILDHTQTIEYKRRRGVGVDFSITDPEYRMLEALGLTNPATIGWELVPFSFVVDWFVPIGDSLRSLTAYKGLQFRGGYTYLKEEISQQQDPFIEYRDSGCGDYPYIEHPAYIHRTINNFDRYVMSSFDDLRVNPWETSNGLNAIRALDAVSLLQSVLKQK